jgi:hypothetical protein
MSTQQQQRRDDMVATWQAAFPEVYLPAMRADTQDEMTTFLETEVLCDVHAMRAHAYAMLGDPTTGFPGLGNSYDPERAVGFQQFLKKRQEEQRQKAAADAEAAAACDK